MFTRRMVCRCCLLATLLLASPSARAVDALGDLTGPWQLFVDDYVIEQKSNLLRTYHPFQKYAGNPVIVADKPWEGTIIYVYGTALPNETHTGYRLWYHALPSGAGNRLLYATSTDGIQWTKPNLNIVTYNGSTDNNIFLQRNTSDHISSLIHTPWESDPQRRYKLINFNSPLGGFLGALSGDGIHFTDEPANPLVTGTGDVGNFIWDFHTSRYVGYVKLGSYVAGMSRRSVAITSTTNWASWPPASLILAPDEFDDRWATGTNKTDFYGLCAFPYESMYIGFLWVLRVNSYFSGCQDGPIFVELVTSHDGIHWGRQEGNRPPILPNGPAGWDAGMVFTTQQPLVENGLIKLYYGGFNGTHCGSNWIGGIGLASLRKDGFASLDAGPTAASLLTRKLVGATGSLHVNYSAGSGGTLAVEVLDENGNVIPGYSEADCTPLQADSLDSTVSWGSQTMLPASASPLRLRFTLQNASIYSFRTDQPVTVLQLPVITQQPQLQRIPPGAAAQFTVAANGIAPLNYRWQRNGVDLADDGPIAGSGTSILTINPVQGSDAAAYRCVVSDSAGTTTSVSADLRLGTYAFSEMILPGATTSSAGGMSADGSVVCGTSGGRAFVWTPELGAQDTGLPSNATAVTAAGLALRPDGRVVMGINATTATGQRAQQWTGFVAGFGSFTDLPKVGAAGEWTVRGLGTDGSEVWIVGSSINTGDGQGREAVIYRQSTGTLTRPALPTTGHDHSDFHAVSDNGFATGQFQYSGSAPTGGARNAWQYTKKGAVIAMNSLVGVPSVSYEAVAKAISRDGVVQGGWSGYAGGGALARPVIWKNPLTLASIPLLAGDNYGEVHALSGDGSIAAGTSYFKSTPNGPSQAFIWDAVNGTRKLQDVLIARGFSLSGWTLQDVVGISADGTMLCGNGLLNGLARGWIVAFIDVSPRAPKIVRDPEAQVVAPGGLATFITQAVGTAPISFRWQRNEVDLHDGGSYTGTGTPTLTVSNVGVSDEGLYRCRVANGSGETFSAIATLTVVSVKPDFDRDGDVDQEDFGHLQTCLTAPGVPQTDPDCQNTKLDTNEYVDSSDLLIFLNCMNGPNRSPSPTCGQ